MSNVAAVQRFVAANWPKLVKAWPHVRRAIEFAAANVDLSKRAQRRVGDLVQRIADAQQRHGDAAKIRALLQGARETAGEIDADDAAGSSSVAEWLLRAQRIERAVGLADKQTGAAKKKALTGLKQQTDELVADMIAAMTA